MDQKTKKNLEVQLNGSIQSVKAMAFDKCRNNDEKCVEFYRGKIAGLKEALYILSQFQIIDNDAS